MGRQTMNDKPHNIPGDEVINNEILELSIETKRVSDQIGMLKRKKNRLKEGPEKDKLTEEIKLLQYQALFCLEKMENLNTQMKANEYK